VIVLDTNALVGRGYGPSPSSTLLRALAAETGHPLAIPQEVLDEYLAKYEREVAPLIDAGSAEKLLASVPHWRDRGAVARGDAGASLPSLAPAIKERRESLTKRPSTRFAVLETPPGAADEGIRREKSRRPPATAGGHEARDVVVWLTVVAAAAAARPSNIYFVSSDRGFTGDDRRHLHPDLLREAPSNLKFLPSVEALIERLSCGAEPIDDIGASREVLTAIEQTALHGGSDPNHDLRRDLWDWTPDGLNPSDLVSAGPSLVSERAVISRSVGDTTLTAIDAIYRLDLRYRAEGSEPVAVSVRLGVLIVHDGGDVASVRVLARSGIRPHGPDEHVEESDGTE